MQMKLETAVIDMQFASENSYLWFFKEIANIQSRIDELKHGILYQKSSATSASIQRLEKEETELIKKASESLPQDLYERIGLLTKNIRTC